MSGRYRRPPNTSLFVRNLSYSVKTEELRSIFTKYGPITDVYVPLDFHTQKPRGFAYVQYEDVRDAEEALHQLDGFHMHGNPLEIQYAEGDRKTPGQMRIRERGDPYFGGSRDYYSRRYREDDRYVSRYGRDRDRDRERDYDRDRYMRSSRRERDYYSRRSYSRSYSRSPRRMYRERHHRSSRSRSRSYSRSYSRSRSHSLSHSPHSKRRSDK
ncbi:Serine/arginine-rich splicing factor 10-like [Oopsacas minuta]|uniref:Serine/arginine-rich splicing factor 10-like n=1 Tax=Oopsacas minuta TaxID=111878 RepID=A0AAV7JLQ9_9METZ|nr:Serine/arginine-rich splicing factor 10-like [Oopsacas minuta]